MAKNVQKRKKVPLRTCIGCGEAKPKRELLRIVRTPEREVLADRSGKMNGRGTYVCYDQGCVKAAIKKKKIEYALDVTLKRDELERIEKEVLQVIKDAKEVG